LKTASRSSQCYIAAPFALAVDIALVIGRLHSHALTLAAWAIFAGALTWYVAVQAAWFAEVLNISRSRALRTALLTLVESMLAILLVSLVLVFAVAKMG
jgi:hypothetical protein